MLKFATIVAASAALLGLAAPAQAQRPDLSRFDAAQSRNPARTLVLCDTTAFLGSRPQLQANRIMAQRTGRPFEMLLPPYFLVGGRFYSESYERAFYRLSARKQVTRAQVSEIQNRLGRDFIETYRRGGPLPNGFVRDQTKICYAWMREIGVRPGA